MRNEGTLRVGLAFAALLCSLSLVIWRQSHALELLRELDATRSRRAMVEYEKSRLVGRVQVLESRGRIMAVAGARWRMRVPESHEEYVILLRPDDEARPGPRGRLRFVRAGVVEGVAELVRERNR